MSNQTFRTQAEQKAYWKGFEAKSDEVREMGWTAARDKHNADYPPGQALPADMSAEGRAFAFGENEAIMQHIK